MDHVTIKAGRGKDKRDAAVFADIHASPDLPVEAMRAHGEPGILARVENI